MTKPFTRLLEFIKLYKRPLKISFLFTIYQNYTLALSFLKKLKANLVVIILFHGDKYMCVMCNRKRQVYHRSEKYTHMYKKRKILTKQNNPSLLWICSNDDIISLRKRETKGRLQIKEAWNNKRNTKDMTMPFIFYFWQDINFIYKVELQEAMTIHVLQHGVVPGRMSTCKI